MLGYRAGSHVTRAFARRAVIGGLDYRRCISGVVTGLQRWKGRGGVSSCVCVCVCVLMKWREGLVLQDRGRDALRGSEQRVNWI